MKETLKRTLRTFIQAAAGYIGANIVYVVSAGKEDLNYLKTALMGLCMSAIAAGIAALMNVPKKETDGDTENG